MPTKSEVTSARVEIEDLLENPNSENVLRDIVESVLMHVEAMMKARDTVSAQARAFITALAESMPGVQSTDFIDLGILTHHGGRFVTYVRSLLEGSTSLSSNDRLFVLAVFNIWEVKLSQAR